MTAGNVQDLGIPEMLASTADKYPSRTALAYVDGDVFTYAQLQNRVAGLCSILQEAGLKKGDKVAILSENSPQWGIVFLAAASMGAVAVPILTQFHSEAIIHIIRHSEARAVFVSRSLYPKIQEAELKGLALFYTDDFSQAEDSAEAGKGLKNAINTGFKGLDRLKQAAWKWANHGHAEKVKPDDLAVIVYTSGTTGNSKGVMLTHGNLLYDAARAGEIVSAGHEDRFLSILPLAHTYECSLGLLAPLIHGASVYYLREAPTPRILLPAMGKVQPTIVLMVPLIIEKIFKTRILPQLNKNKVLRAAYRIPFIRTRLHRLAGKKMMQSFGGRIKALCIGGAPLAGEAERFLRDA
ncbi:MAG: AMP-binding protein, partial [Desulfonatronovibrionaceae bacterium]